MSANTRYFKHRDGFANENILLIESDGTNCRCLCKVGDPLPCHLTTEDCDLFVSTGDLTETDSEGTPL